MATVASADELMAKDLRAPIFCFARSPMTDLQHWVELHDRLTPQICSRVQSQSYLPIFAGGSGTGGRMFSA